jgi:hypothetical protein
MMGISDDVRAAGKELIGAASRLLELPRLRVKPKAGKPKLDVSHAQLRQPNTIAPVNTAPHEQRS